MKKVLLRGLFFVFAVCLGCVFLGVLTVCKDDSQGVAYAPSGDKSSYTVVGLDVRTNTAIVIPSEYRGLPVTGIGDRAFFNCSDLTSVVIPDGLRSIGYGAFSFCARQSRRMAKEG